MSTMTFTPTGAKRPAQMAAGPPMGILSGLVNITSYATAHVAATALTGFFKPSGLLTVVCDGVSSGGYAMRWNPANSDFYAYLQTGTAAVLTEAGNAVNVGTFNIIAFGQMG